MTQSQSHESEGPGSGRTVSNGATFSSEDPIRLRRIATIDPWAASLAASTILLCLAALHILLNIAWGHWGFSDSARNRSEVTLLYAGLVVGLLLPAIVGLTIRTRRLQARLSEGVPVDGVVTELVEHQRQIVAMKVSYSYQGQAYRDRVRIPNPNLIQRNPLRSFSEGSRIRVVVDRSRPQSGLVLDLYRDEPIEKPGDEVSDDGPVGRGGRSVRSSWKWRWVTLAGILAWTSPLWMLVTDALRVPTLLSNFFVVVVGAGMFKLFGAADPLVEHLIKVFVTIVFSGLLVLALAT